MAKKTIDQKIDELTIITTKGFRRVERKIAVLETDVAMMKGDVVELKEGHSWMAP